MHVDMNKICAIVGCNERISASDKRTCNDPVHQQVEAVHVERGQAAFQLKEKMKRARVAHPKNGEAVDLPVPHITEQGGDNEDDLDLDETYEIIGDRVIHSEEDAVTHTALARASLTATINNNDHIPAIQQPVVPIAPSTKKKIRAKFGRSQTHNEQILVAPCGIIIARETFYHAESITAVVVCVIYYKSRRYCGLTLFLKEMIKRTYQGGFMPNHIIFDNNCSVARHVKDDPDFKNVGLAVDVFHFANKHAETDYFCQSKCNQALFPELLGENGKGWLFNTSISEQTNVWLGGFHSICREMSADMYDFFLDEMIMMRNRATKARVASQNLNPQWW
jgi:hypothetical protein